MQNHPYAWSNIPPKLWSLFTSELDDDTKLRYMREAIAEVEQSSLFPTVGSVVVKNDRIVGRGRRTFSAREKLWKGKIRITHAEHAALLDAGEQARGADLYTTLEPCYERGIRRYLELIQPCSFLIPQFGIQRVIIGLVDQDARTRGQGVERLVQYGVKVEFAYQGLEKKLYRLIDDGNFRRLIFT